MSLAVFLPPQLLAHVRHVFISEPDFLVANSWKNLEEIIRREPVTVAIVDPGADGVMDVDAVAGFLTRFPSLPIVGYVMLTPSAFGAIAQLSKRGLTHVVLHRFDDSRERLQQTIARVSSNPPSQRLLNLLTPALRQVPLTRSRAVRDMFEKPNRYTSVLDLATRAGLPPVSVYRYLEIANVAPPKKLLIGAKLSRGITYLRDPGYSIREVALKLGYRHPRILTAHALEVFDLTPSRLRTRLSEDDAMALLVRWIDIPQPPAPGTRQRWGQV